MRRPVLRPFIIRNFMDTADMKLLSYLNVKELIDYFNMRSLHFDHIEIENEIESNGFYQKMSLSACEIIKQEIKDDSQRQNR